MSILAGQPTRATNERANERASEKEEKSVCDKVGVLRGAEATAAAATVSSRRAGERG